MLGIFGGTFDPVHQGHLQPALSVQRALGLSSLLFIPNRLPPHRGEPWLDLDRRLQLLRLALTGLPDVHLDLREIEREGPSFMVDTLASLQADYPGEPLCLILGMDAFAGIHRWHRWRELFERAHVVVTLRPGFAAEPLAAFTGEVLDFLQPRLCPLDAGAEALQADKAGRILLKSVPQLDISATGIRRALATGEAVDDCLPAAVADQLQRWLQAGCLEALTPGHTEQPAPHKRETDDDR